MLPSRRIARSQECQRETPLVSIVLPVYNAGNYLSEAIDSVLQQSYTNIEMIVLDDGSTDNAREILASYPKGSFYWDSHPNMGQSATLNKGWNMAHGKILSYLSADDALLPGAVASAVSALGNRHDLIMVYGDYELMDDQSKLIRRVVAPDFSYHEMLRNIVVQPGPGAFFRKSGFERVGGWNTALRQVPDYEFWLRLGLLGPFLHIAELWARFRMHEASQSFRASDVRKSDEIVEVIEQFFDGPELPVELMEHKAVSMAMANVVAARFHMRAKRSGLFLSRLFSAIRHDGRIPFRTRTLRLIANALVHRMRYP